MVVFVTAGDGVGVGSSDGDGDGDTTTAVSRTESVSVFAKNCFEYVGKYFAVTATATVVANTIDTAVRTSNGLGIFLSYYTVKLAYWSILAFVWLSKTKHFSKKS